MWKQYLILILSKFLKLLPSHAEENTTSNETARTG